MTRQRFNLFKPALLIAIIACPQASNAGEKLEHVDQAELNQLSAQNGLAAFEYAFDAGDELTEFTFRAEHGVGANIGEGRRFTRFPRADLKGEGEWASHLPMREGGANATSCIACHNAPIANGAGDIALNVVVDPSHSGDPALYLERNTLPLFALGPVQVVAEEMSLALYKQRAMTAEIACKRGEAKVSLMAKGISFGALSAMRISTAPCKIKYDFSAVQGVDDDLVVKAFGWKGNKATIRDFTRGAAHNELGLQAVETIGNQDGDYDGIINELSVGDMTALTVYMAALERPVSTLELANMQLVEVSNEQRKLIKAGAQLFGNTGCSACHTPTLPIENAVFSEPSKTPCFYDVTFPDGSNPKNHSFIADRPVSFDMTKDQPNNQIPYDNMITHLGALKLDRAGRPHINWFSDFKRHDMGPDLADPADPLGIGANMWLTRSLAGVASTGPWMHDGRATTISEAIMIHGGEGADSRNAFAALPISEQAQMIAFLESLVVFKYDPEKVVQN